MNNLLCTILFCLTSSSLVNADCSTYPEVKNATFNKEDKCGDITIRCDKGFTMEQVTECIDGEWKYQEPFCKPLECSYEFTNKTHVESDNIGDFQDQNEIECDKRCNDNTNCTTTIISSGDCFLYPAPLIFRSQLTGLDECITKCTQMKECLMLSHWGGSQECYLFNDTQNNLPGGFRVYDAVYDTVAEKLCA